MSGRRLLPGALALLVACSAAPAAGPPHKILQPEVTKSLHYEITPHGGGADLSIVATLPPGLPADLAVDQSMISWVKSPEVEVQGGWEELPFNGESWRVSGCEGGCRVRYGYDLAAAADRMDDVSYAAVYSGAYLAPPSTWLLHPAADLISIPFRFHVSAPPGVGFVTGVLPAPGAEASYGADISDLPDAPYSAFGRFDELEVPYRGGVIDVAIVNSSAVPGNRLIERWIRQSASAVIAYYGQFPLPHSAIIVILGRGAEVGGASALGNGGGAIVIRVGRDIAERDLLHSWQMTHEMMHLSFPNLPRRYRWLEEGMATYVEPIARARAGALSEEEVWDGMVKGMGYGLPLAGEGGLDDTPTWGRIYWGGALFCLLADVRIHEQTSNAKGLDDAFVAILEQGGNVGSRWEIERLIEAGDKATGTTVLRDLYEQMGRAAMAVDLPALWARLGVRRRAGAIELDESAPLAAVRKAILSRPARSAPLKD